MLRERNQVLRFKAYLAGVTILTVFGAIFIFYLTETISPIYNWGFVLLVPFAIALWIIYQKMRQEKTLAEMRSQWGKPVKRDRMFKSLESAYHMFPRDEDTTYKISKQTWDDLHLDRIFTLFDRTLTSPGEQILHNMLRTPLLSKSMLEERKDTIRLLEENSKLREEIQKYLLRLGRQYPETLTHFLWGDDFKSAAVGWVPNLLALLALISMGSVAFLGMQSICFLCSQSLALTITIRASGCSAFCSFSKGWYREMDRTRVSGERYCYSCREHHTSSVAKRCSQQYCS
ncbi:MAG: hypothetical protein SCK29_03895 [Bacillota bacterium]|nr:hypothetical protein [Bacillota bacterium]MDW7683249.1 hypothetical protein [Bacillota bacterium]